MKISEILREATAILQDAGVAEPRREAASLLAFALEKDKTFLIAHSEYKLSPEEKTRFQSFLDRRAAGEPLQYITGRQEFYGLDFWVTKDVLIPRPETELIVEAAVEILLPLENPSFCEVGTGSGCISVSILHVVKNASATGLDISERALEITRKNAEKHGVDERLNLKKSDVFSALRDEKFDLIVSNPPYVSLGEIAGLQREVRDFEPHIALTDGGSGLAIIEKIIEDAPVFLRPKGFLLMEIGFTQSPKVAAMPGAEIWQTPEFLPDLQGIPRMLKAKLKV
jgi:release factor glutamine methyltransferase